MEIPEEYIDFNIGKDIDLEDKIGHANEHVIVYPGSQLPILAPGKAVRVRKDVSELGICLLLGGVSCVHAQVEMREWPNGLLSIHMGFEWTWRCYCLYFMQLLGLYNH